MDSIIASFSKILKGNILTRELRESLIDAVRHQVSHHRTTIKFK
jgi:hypothetical protein